MLKSTKLAGLVTAAVITLGGALMATPAQATVPRPQPVQNSVQRTIHLRAGEGCEFPVRISVRIRDLDRFRTRNGQLVVRADGVRGRVTNLRNGDTFRYRGDTEYRIRRNGLIRGDGAQLLLLNRNRGRVLEVGRNIVPRPEPRRVNRLFFTEDPTRGQLLGGRVPVLPRERLIRAGSLENVCAQIREPRRLVRR